MSVDQTHVVDAMGIDSQTGDMVLTIVDHLEWSVSGKDHLLLLQEKLNSYLSFVESGEILQAYPDAGGRSIVIDVVCKYTLTEPATQFFAQAEPIVQEAGMKLRHRKFSADLIF